VSEHGVTFRSKLDGSLHEYTPERVIQVQRNLGADVIMQLDELIDGGSDIAPARAAMERSLRWLERCHIEFDRITRDGAGLPFHAAIKPVPHVDATGTMVIPDAPNGVKFELFIFDALPLADRVCSLEAAREDEFSPIKNADGVDSPATARRDLTRVYAGWLEAAGVAVPRDSRGEPAVDIEIDPRYASSSRELIERIPPGFEVTGPTVLGAPAG